MQQDTGLDSHNFYGRKNQTEKKYGIKRAKMPTAMNEGVDIHLQICQYTSVYSFLIELVPAIEKSKGSLKAYIYIR